MRWSCAPDDAERTAAVIAVTTDVREVLREDLGCADGSASLAPIHFAFELKEPETFNMRIGFRYGTVEHDRTVLTWTPPA